jgi:hypothetical protein
MSDRLEAMNQALADHRELVKAKVELVQGRQQARAKVAGFIEGAETKDVRDVGKLLLQLIEGQEEALDQVEQRLDLFLEMYFKQMIEFVEAAESHSE